GDHRDVHSFPTRRSSDLTGNNLKNVSVEFPLGTLICVTGVSGSGKSTLINQTLYPILNQHFFNAVKKPMPYKKIEGLEHIDKVIDRKSTRLNSSHVKISY